MQENPKLHDAEAIERDVMYIMSMPRLAFTDNMFCLINAVHRVRMFGQRHGGAFWEQGVENLLETAIEKGFKYALAIDYDTYYTEYHIADLYRLMEAHPEIDVMLPLQPRRGHDFPMAGIFQDEYGHKVKVYTKDNFVNGIAPCDTGHFGLSIVRLDSLSRLAKPWFISTVDENNAWHQGHKDADVHFWIKCKHEGLKVALAEVWIGHIQSLCSWCGPAETGYRTHHQYINETLDGQIPKWAMPRSFHEAQRRSNSMSDEQAKPEVTEVPDLEPEKMDLTPAGSEKALEAEQNLEPKDAEVKSIKSEIDKHERAMAELTRTRKELATKLAQCEQMIIARQGAIEALKQL